MTRVLEWLILSLSAVSKPDASAFKQISSNPRIFYAQHWIKNLSDSEVDDLFRFAQKEHPVQSSSTADGTAELTRKSESMFLSSEFVNNGSKRILQAIVERLPHELKLSRAHFETMQLVSYEGSKRMPGFYGPHTDGMGRIATLLVYLSDHRTDCGGETVFPFVDASGRATPPHGLQRHDLIKQFRVSNWTAIWCSAHGSNLDILRFFPKRGDAILFFHHPAHAKSVEGDSDNLAFHGACPLRSHDCGVRRIAQQWVTYDWISPRDDEAIEISMKEASKPDISQHKLHLKWHPSHTRVSQSCEKSSEAACSSDGTKDKLVCTRLDVSVAERFRASGANTIVIAVPCAWGSPFHAEGVLELRLGKTFKWRLIARNKSQKDGGCRIEARAQNMDWKENASVALDVRGNQLWRTVALMSRTVKGDRMEITLIADSSNKDTRAQKTMSNMRAPFPKHDASSIDKVTWANATRAAGGVKVCLGPGAISNRQMIHHINVWSRSFNAFEQDRIWKWMDPDVPGPAKAQN